jgi:hypothetical protein
MQKLVNIKKNLSLVWLKFVSLNAFLEVGNKKSFLGENRWRFSRKAKSLIVFAIIVVMLISILSFLPKQSESSPLPKNTDTPTVSPSTGSPSTSSPSETATPKISNQPIASPGPYYVSWQDPNMPVTTSTPKPPGVIKSSQTVNSTMWLAIATNAWEYFQPGVGVDPNTGLPNCGYGSPIITDWDVGV